MEHHGPSVTGSPALSSSDATVRALQDAMQRQLSMDSASNVCTPELTRAIRAMCVQAREHGMRAEEVLVLFKTMWMSLPVANAQLVGQRRTELLERAVALCIKSYYTTAD
jgi:hypothetical protein